MSYSHERTYVPLLDLKTEEGNHEIGKVSSLEKLGKEKELSSPSLKVSRREGCPCEP